MIAQGAEPLPPAEAARRAAAGPGAFWLSGPGDDPAAIGRDFVGSAPHEVVGGDGPRALVRLERAWSAARAAWAEDGEAPIAGVPLAVGWLSYELGRRLVGLPPGKASSGTGFGGLFGFHFYDAVWVRETDGTAWIFARDGAAAERLQARLTRPAPASPARLGPLEPVHPERVFLEGVGRILDYLRAGDAYQVNLSRRLQAPWDGGDPLSLAERLRARAPAPHAAFIAAPDVAGGACAILGNSPERFLALGPDGRVETCPIKGTRPRRADPAEDRAAAAALAASPKDRAEHVMIVDLERNDLGRVCRAGSVEVIEPARGLSLPTVHHLVSTVRGQLRPEVGLAGLLAATFPGGSITGAPKKRAMQIIDELEPTPRGIYTGATGWLGAAGDLDLAIAIRTAVVAARRLEVSVGGGVVVESTPEAELDETRVKARAFAELGGATPASPPPR